MAFFPVKESEKDPTDFLSTFERLHNTGDCILSDFLDFPHCSQEMQSENLYSLDLPFKTETYPWSNPKFEASQSTEYICTLDEKVDDISDGNFFKSLTADSLPEESNYRDRVVPSYEIPNDFHALAMNTSAVDVLDYLEDAEASFNMTSKSTTYYNSCWENDTLFSRNKCPSCVGNNTEQCVERGLCSSHQGSYSYNWSTDDTRLELIPCLAAQNNALDTLGTVDNQETADKTYFAYNGASWTDRSLKAQQEEKDVLIGQFYSASKSTTSATVARSSAIDKTIQPINTSSLYITAPDSSRSGHTKQYKNVEELSGPQSGSKSVFNIHLLKKSVHPVDQRRQAEPSFRETTSCSLVATSHQLELQYSSDINTDLQRSNSDCSDLKTIIPIPLLNTTSRESGCIGIINPNTPNAVRKTSTTISDIQTNEPLGAIKILTNKETKYMKVGKRGRFITVPADKVNKLMVRDLLSMSGNRAEMNIKDQTEEYRQNIRQILEQKRKRLNIV